MASAAAALLDELMGRNRNANPNDSGGIIKWDDSEVCKNFLCGYCPSELFVNTKADLGPCTLLHDEPLRKEYQNSSRFEKMGYEEAWIEALEDIVNEVDKKIKRGHQRLAMTQSNEPSPTHGGHGPRQEQITQLTAKIDDLVDKAEKLGNEGKVEEAQGVMKLCEQLKKERMQLENLSNDRNETIPQAKQMEVCPICGAFLIVGDAESRQREHLMGKQHMGYAQMRATVSDYKEKKRQKIAAHKAEMEKRREEDRRKRDEQRNRRRSRSGDRRDRNRRGGSRERRRSRSRDRRRSRSRDRKSRDSRSSRDRGSSSKRSRSRDRRRSRDVGGRDDKRGSRTSSRDRGNRSRDRERGGSSRRSESRSKDDSRANRNKSGEEKADLKSKSNMDTTQEKNGSRGEVTNGNKPEIMDTEDEQTMDSTAADSVKQVNEDSNAELTQDLVTQD